MRVRFSFPDDDPWSQKSSPSHDHSHSGVFLFMTIICGNESLFPFCDHILWSQESSPSHDHNLWSHRMFPIFAMNLN